MAPAIPIILGALIAIPVGIIALIYLIVPLFKAIGFVIRQVVRFIGGEIGDALRARSATTIVRHLCMNPQVEVLNETHARGRGHLLVLRHHCESGITEPTVCADYRDEYVRVGPEWRFAVRDVELAFGETATEVGPR